MSSEVPEGWTSGSLLNFFQLQRGHDLPVQDRNPGQVPVIASNGVVGSHNQSPLPGPGVITGRSGTIGNVSYVEGAYWPLNTTLYVRDFKGADPKFVYYFLQNFPLKDHQSGTGVPTLNRNDVHAVDVVFPPLDEQRRIAEVLRSVDEAIATADAVEAGAVKALSRVRDVVILEPCFDRVTLAEATAKGLFTDGDWVESKDQDPDGEVRLIQLADVGDGTFIDKSKRFLTMEKAHQLRCTFLKEGDLLLARMPDPLGRCCLFPSLDHPSVTVVDVCVIRGGPATSNRYLAHALSTSEFRQQVLACASGTTRTRVSRGNLGGLEVPVPVMEDQQAIADILDQLQEVANQQKAAADMLRTVKQNLMSDLLSGRVRVHAPVIAASGKTVPPAFKRAVFAAEIVHQLHNDNRFGSVKHEKIVHLCELHLGLQGDLDRHAYKEAAGPYDPNARRSVERIFQQQKWFDATKPDGNRVVYVPLEKAGGHAEYFDRYFGEQKDAIQSIIDLLRPLNTEQCEIVATLYAVWNDFLIERRQPTDDEIVASVLQWHPKKQQITEDRWMAALPWMRQKSLIPKGTGEKTRVAQR